MPCWQRWATFPYCRSSLADDGLSPCWTAAATEGRRAHKHTHMQTYVCRHVCALSDLWWHANHRVLLWRQPSLTLSHTHVEYAQTQSNQRLVSHESSGGRSLLAKMEKSCSFCERGYRAEFTSAVLSHSGRTPQLACFLLFLFFIQKIYFTSADGWGEAWQLGCLGNLKEYVVGMLRGAGGILHICSITLSEMNFVLSHARNVPSVPTHPLTCPTTYHCLEQKQNTAKCWSLTSPSEVLRFSVKTHTRDFTSFLFHVTTFIHYCAENGTLHRNICLSVQFISQAAETNTLFCHTRFRLVILCILSTQSTKHDNHQKPEGSRRKFKPEEQNLIYVSSV